MTTVARKHRKFKRHVLSQLIALNTPVYFGYRTHFLHKELHNAETTTADNNEFQEEQERRNQERLANKRVILGKAIVQTKEIPEPTPTGNTVPDSDNVNKHQPKRGKSKKTTGLA